MKPARRTLILPLLLVFLGVGWLLTTLGIGPPIDWAWTLGLAIVGLLAFLVSGFDKVSVLVGPFFIGASLLSYLRQSGRIEVDVELPILVILAGVLLLIARLPAVPLPDWLERDPQAERKA
jgi:hypothetical protein